MIAAYELYKTRKVIYPTSMVLVRTGDFYETFGNDAILMADVLDLQPTEMGNKMKNVGVGAYYLNEALKKLTKRGYMVAVIEEESGVDELV